jgi:hypothetical protein
MVYGIAKKIKRRSIRQDNPNIGVSLEKTRGGLGRRKAKNGDRALLRQNRVKLVFCREKKFKNHGILFESISAQYILMKTIPIHAWPKALPESTITAYNSKTRRNRSDIKLLNPPPIPPDEATIRRLNELAASKPFCTCYRVRKHEFL